MDIGRGCHIPWNHGRGSFPSHRFPPSGPHQSPHVVRRIMLEREREESKDSCFLVFSRVRILCFAFCSFWHTLANSVRKAHELCACCWMECKNVLHDQLGSARLRPPLPAGFPFLRPERQTEGQ